MDPSRMNLTTSTCWLIPLAKPCLKASAVLSEYGESVFPSAPVDGHYRFMAPISVQVPGHKWPSNLALDLVEGELQLGLSSRSLTLTNKGQKHKTDTQGWLLFLRDISSWFQGKS